MRIARVFPRRTRATPTDPLAFVGAPDMLAPECDAVHISVAFAYDLPEAERLSQLWRDIAPVTIGGPATGERGGDFVAGQYLAHGYTITSRGCPNRCWFCSVWRREGDVVRELPIVEGWNVLDDNLLACSDAHIKAVLAMLARQSRRPEFTGGLEAARLRPWHAAALRDLRPKQLFFAYDTPNDLEPLREAGRILLDAGFTTASHTLRAYVLCGFRGDSFDAAEARMSQTREAGFMPMAMLYRDHDGARDPEWMRWTRLWARPAISAVLS